MCVYYARDGIAREIKRDSRALLLLLHSMKEFCYVRFHRGRSRFLVPRGVIASSPPYGNLNTRRESLSPRLFDSFTAAIEPDATVIKIKIPGAGWTALPIDTGDDLIQYCFGFISEAVEKK